MILLNMLESIPLPAIHDDELGLLTHTFNAMMQKLRSKLVT